MKSKKQPINKIAVGIIAIIILLVGWLLFSLFWVGDTRPIVKAANVIKIPHEWSLVSEHIEPPRIICLGSSACPSIHRRWDIREPISNEHLREIMDESSINAVIEGDCDAIDQPNGSATTCQVPEVLIDEYIFELYISRNDYGVINSLSLVGERKTSGDR